MSQLAVSVIMGVHNGERFLPAATGSILAQVFTDFEFIIVDDGSTDRTAAILEGYDDSRIVHLHNERNLGLTASLNRALACARGRYIARQDADDLSLPDRLAQQAAFLDANPGVALVSCWTTVIAEDGREQDLLKWPAGQGDRVRQLWESNHIVHGSIMLRRDCLTTVGGYDESFTAAQDYDLWLRLAESFDLAIIPTPLYRWRHHRQAIGVRRRAVQQYHAARAIERSMQRQLGQNLGAGERTILARRFALAGLAAVAQVDSALARECFARVEQYDLGWLESHEFVEMVGQQAVAPAYTEHGRSGMADGMAFAGTVLGLAPLPIEHLPRLRAQVLGQVQATAAFAAHQVGQRAEVARQALGAIRHDPAWLRHRGLRSIVFQAVTGIRRG